MFYLPVTGLLFDRDIQLYFGAPSFKTQAIMLLRKIIYCMLVCALCITNIVTAFAQQYKKNNYDLKIHQRIFSRIERNFDSAFYHYPENLDTTITIAQNALIQFTLKNGVIDTFYIWSVNDIKTSHWRKPFISPLIGIHIDTCKKYDYILCSVIVSDYETKERPNNVLNFSTNLFNTLVQSSFKRTLVVGSAVLNCKWSSILKSRMKPERNPDGSYNLPEK
jgi:hypothetical protein